MNKINEMRIDFFATEENVAFARAAVSAFLLPLNPTLEELEDVRTAVSEAVTNAILHGYEGKGGTVRLSEPRSGWKSSSDAEPCPKRPRDGVADLAGSGPLCYTMG